MAEFPTYPPGSYVTVRGQTDGWAAVVAHEGRVISLATVPGRSEAFELAEKKAAREGLPCLVSRAVA